MKITTIEDKAVSQSVTIQITFDSVTEMHAVKTVMGMSNSRAVREEMVRMREEQTGTQDDYHHIIFPLYAELHNLYKRHADK